MPETTLFGFGLLLDLLGVLFISLDLVSRIDRYEERLRGFLRDLATPLFTPAYLFQTFQDLYFSRRRSFWFLVVIPVLLLPQYAAWVAQAAPVRLYLHGLGILWLAIGAFCLPLVLLSLLLWTGLCRRSRFPVWVDHLLTVAAFPLRPGLVATLPAAFIFLLLPIVLNLVVVKGLVYILYAANTLLTHFPVLDPGRTVTLRLLGVLCLSAGVTAKLIAVF